MRSVQLVAPRKLEITDVKQPDGPAPGEILVRIRAVGLCGSDMHWYLHGNIHGHPARYPMVLGHEPVGEVVACGSGVTSLQPGNRVSLEPTVSCGHCEYCMAGRFNNCIHGIFMGSPTAEGFLRDYVAIPAHNADVIPEQLDWHRATLMEPVAVWVHIYELMRPRPGDTVAILGAGSIGLLGIQMARLAGAARIIAADRVGHRLAMARAMGAHLVVDLRSESLRDAVMDATKGRGADITYDAAGAPETINAGLVITRPTGDFVLVGIPSELMFPVDLQTAMSKEVRIHTVKRSNHKGKPAGDLLAQGLISTDVITHTLPAGRAAEGFEMLAAYADGIGKLVFDFSA
jgi:L-iditol 2-dehydrogenase